MRAGFGFERQPQSRPQQGLRRRVFVKQRRIRGKSGSVGEQRAQRDVLLAAARLHADDEAREDIAESLIEVEPAAVDEQHRGGGGGQHLREAGEIENRLWLDGWRTGFIGEAADGVDCHRCAAMQDSPRGTGERALPDCLLQKGAGRGETLGRDRVGLRSSPSCHEDRVPRGRQGGCIGGHEIPGFSRHRKGLARQERHVFALLTHLAGAPIFFSGLLARGGTLWSNKARIGESICGFDAAGRWTFAAFPRAPARVAPLPI